MTGEKTLEARMNERLNIRKKYLLDALGKVHIDDTESIYSLRNDCNALARLCDERLEQLGEC